MPWRRRSFPALSLAFPLLGLASPVAHAQEAPPASSSSTSASPPSEPAPAPPPARPSLIAPAPTASASATPAAATPPPINPSRDPQSPAAQGAQRPDSGELAAGSAEVFSEDWWGRARPIIDLHGFFRTRAELFQNFSLGRRNSSFQSNDPQFLWPIPLDQSYTSLSGAGASGGATVSLCGPATPLPNQPCSDKTESGANVRFRLDPEIHISDNLRILSEIDLLDNVVLGSTPNSYATQPATSTNASMYPSGYASAGTTSAGPGYNAYAPVGFFSTTQGPPTAGVNSNTNSIEVKRVWGEYVTPVGQLRFGRMPSQWGLGMVDNAGDGIDSDYQTTTDRIMFITGLKSMDLYFGGAWDFISTGPTATPGSNATTNAYSIYGGQPYNTCNLCNVNEWAAFAARKTNPDMQRLSLARGDVVVNGGVYTKFRSQDLDVAGGATPQTIDYSSTALANGLEVRRAWAVTPDLWVQILWDKLRIEAEAAMIWGEIGNLPGLNADVGNPVDIRQFGVATQTQYLAIDDKLNLQFGFGWASGDPAAVNTAGGATQMALAPQPGLPTRESDTNGPLATFAFHPDYRVDLIFWRNIMTQIQGAYYFRPSVDYDFIRHADGEKLGGGAAVIWSRASEFVQTPGHESDLGVELDGQIYYQSKDGSLNDDPSKIGGFYSMLQYGVFFPLAGLNYLTVPTGQTAGLSAAQIVRLFLGIAF
jgi:uncharacterized protein (TIGR04551 family)